MPFPSASEKDSKAIELLKTLVGFDTTSYNSNLELIEFIQSYLSSYDIVHAHGSKVLFRIKFTT